MSGGQAIENAARKASDPNKFFFDTVLTRYRNCQFTFAGISNKCLSHITRQEKKFNIDADTIIPDVYDLCAALQIAIVKHICLRTQRAMEFISNLNLIQKDKRTLVCLNLYTI